MFSGPNSIALRLSFENRQGSGQGHFCSWLSLSRLVSHRAVNLAVNPVKKGELYGPGMHEVTNILDPQGGMPPQKN